MADFITVDREELLCDVYTVKEGKPFPYREAYKKLINRLVNAPAVEAEPVVHGHWERKRSGSEFNSPWYCSVEGCNAVTRTKTPYCWHCGAKMDEVSDGIMTREEVSG